MKIENSKMELVGTIERYTDTLMYLKVEDCPKFRGYSMQIDLDEELGERLSKLSDNELDGLRVRVEGKLVIEPKGFTDGGYTVTSWNTKMYVERMFKLKD